MKICQKCEAKVFDNVLECGVCNGTKFNLIHHNN
jgi:hypothetical protein